MRLALIATPALLPDLRPAPGALDGDLLRLRLPSRDDTDFTLLDLDPAVDVAEQLDAIFDRSRPGPDDAVLFYASCAVVISVEGELFLCLDPANPETGDALEDVTAVIRDRAPGPVLIVLECRHPPDPSDPFRSAAVVAAARAAVSPAKSGVGLLVAARPIVDDLTDRASPFTRAFVEAIDALAGPHGATAETIYQHILESEALIGVVPCFAHARGRTAFPLVPLGAAASQPAPPIAQEPEEDEGEGEEVSGWGTPPGADADAVDEPPAPPPAPSTEERLDGEAPDEARDGGFDVEVPVALQSSPGQEGDDARTTPEGEPEESPGLADAWAAVARQHEQADAEAATHADTDTDAGTDTDTDTDADTDKGQRRT